MPSRKWCLQPLCKPSLDTCSGHRYKHNGLHTAHLSAPYKEECWRHPGLQLFQTWKLDRSRPPPRIGCWYECSNVYSVLQTSLHYWFSPALQLFRSPCESRWNEPSHRNHLSWRNVVPQSRRNIFCPYLKLTEEDVPNPCKRKWIRYRTSLIKERNVQNQFQCDKCLGERSQIRS